MQLKETLRIRVNGVAREIEAPPNRTLLDLLREDLSLTGTKCGCDDACCGACTVLVDGAPRLSCITLAFCAEEAEVVTIEGAAEGSPLTRAIQDSLVKEGGLQCGFCTPGIVLAARSLLDRCPNPTSDEIREGLSNNLCRCTGYLRIVAAVKQAALSSLLEAVP